MFQVNPLLGRGFEDSHENQALFSSKDKSTQLKCRPLQFLIGALRLNIPFVLLFFILDFYQNLCHKRRGLRT